MAAWQHGKTYGLALAAALLTAAAAPAAEWLNPDGSKPGQSGPDHPGANALPELPLETTPLPPAIPDADHRQMVTIPIPHGHLPPPGECRVWFVDRPPGHQPPPGSCARLRRQVSAGAILIEG